ncbi:alcohol dehydrogenase GroES-like domain-containing protein [Paramyrothecium foliicola]|nr:alcohol dehydrogenase GroES-like domain-containing protein [Paramyrothecium foliicola]
MVAMNEMEKKTMRAVVWEGKPYSVVVRDVPKPTIHLPEDAIIRISTASICGSDLHVYHGYAGSTNPPWVLGHEAVGYVAEVGSATEQFQVGDRVLIPASHKAGHYNVDTSVVPSFPSYGLGSDYGDTGGCQSEYVRVPYADDSLVAIPDQYSSDLDWLFLTDVFVTAWAGLDFSAFEPGDKVAIFGAGPVGLMCVYAAKLRGASVVYCVDHVRKRLDKAAGLGAIPIDFTSEDGIASVQLLRREPKGFKRVIDCVGQPCVNHKLKPQQNYVLQEAITVASIDGGIGLAGVYGSLPKSQGTPNADDLEADLLISTSQLWLKRLTLHGGIIDEHIYKVLPRLIDLVKSGRAQLDFIVSSQMSIEDAPLAYERFDKRLETKVVFRFPAAKDIGTNKAPEKTDARTSKLPIHNGRWSLRV